MDIDKQSKEYQMMISAVREANLHSESSPETIRRFKAQDDSLKQLSEQMVTYFEESKEWRTATDERVNGIYDLLGNLKFSGKMFLMVGSGIIGLVALLGGIKTLLAWVGFNIIDLKK